MTAELKPLIKCRCCGQDIDPQYQPPLIAGRAGFFYLTCLTAGCALENHTFTTRNYEDVDLSPYECKK